WNQGHREEAVRFYREAWNIIRKQGASVAGDEGRQLFNSFQAGFCVDLARAQRAMGDLGGAFRTFEEGRAQALQQLLDERGRTAKLAGEALWQPYQQALAAQHRASRRLEQAGAAVEAAKRAVEAHLAEPGELEQAQENFASAQAACTRARLDVEEKWAAVQ